MKELSHLETVILKCGILFLLNLAALNLVIDLLILIICNY